jgi:hypothetical protein
MKPWKLQKFGSDLMHDLRSRGLLPLAGLLLIAIVAAPFLISRMGGSEDAPAGTGSLEAAAVKEAPEGKAAVVSYAPGVRNSRRLDGDPKNPFIQQHQDQGGDGDGGTEGGAGQDAGTTGNGGVTITGTTRSRLFYFYYETDVRSGEAGQQLKRQNDIDPFTLLPSENVPVAVFMGVANGGNQAVFSVSRQVTNVSGEGTCYPDPDSCELLGISQGDGADLAYAGDNKIYRIEVARIKFIKSRNPPD